MSKTTNTNQRERFKINYLGPPTISPSSPTCGAAGARLFGSVGAGAALKKSHQILINFISWNHLAFCNFCKTFSELEIRMKKKMFVFLRIMTLVFPVLILNFLNQLNDKWC